MPSTNPQAGGARSLRELIAHITPAPLQDAVPDQTVASICCDSRRVKTGDLFVAIPGTKVNAAYYIADAIAAGAVAVIAEDCDAPVDGAALIRVNNAREALACLASAWYGHPSSQLTVAGVTGTNGKTTTSFLIQSIFEEALGHCGLIGTVKYQTGKRDCSAPNTTPGALQTQELLREMVDAGYPAAVLEVSSHGLDQHRVSGVEFDVAAATNLSQDHLDYHSDMDEYRRVKGLFFERLHADATAVLNADRPEFAYFQSVNRGKLLRYSQAGGEAEVRAHLLGMDADGIRFELHAAGKQVEIVMHLVGRYNIENALAASAAALAVGVDLETIKQGLEKVKGVPGRVQRVGSPEGFSVLVDYAHTDDALVNVLRAVREITPGRVICVFGCGGDRDRGKRPKMGRAAEGLADYCVVTSDNPRTEDPQRILDDILAGLEGDPSGRHVEIDRAAAIRHAVNLAENGDCVLVAGKGHETYQILSDGIIPFDDCQVAADAIEARSRKLA